MNAIRPTARSTKGRLVTTGLATLATGLMAVGGAAVISPKPIEATTVLAQEAAVRDASARAQQSIVDRAEAAEAARLRQVEADHDAIRDHYSMFVGTIRSLNLTDSANAAGNFAGRFGGDHAHPIHTPCADALGDLGLLRESFDDDINWTRYEVEGRIDHIRATPNWEVYGVVPEGRTYEVTVTETVRIAAKGASRIPDETTSYPFHLTILDGRVYGYPIIAACEPYLN